MVELQTFFENSFLAQWPAGLIYAFAALLFLFLLLWLAIPVYLIIIKSRLDRLVRNSEESLRNVATLCQMLKKLDDQPVEEPSLEDMVRESNIRVRS